MSSTVRLREQRHPKRGPPEKGPSALLFLFFHWPMFPLHSAFIFVYLIQIFCPSPGFASDAHRMLNLVGGLP